MKDDITGGILAPEPATDWRRVRDQSDEEVHQAVLADPNIVPTSDAFWADARLVTPKR